MTTKRVAKRVLSNFDFTEKGSHLALVHKDQGGAANGYPTLVMKATGKYSPEFLEKATHIQVTLTFEEFLRKFFDMWYDDAEILATMLGMQDDEEDDNYQDYVERQVEKFEILKSAHESKNKVNFLSSLDEEDYLGLLKAQETIEKAFKDAEQVAGKQPAKKTAVSKKTQSLKKKAVPADNTQENNMETIAKAQYDADIAAQQVELQKALADIKKAQEEVEVYKAKEKVELQKARKADLLGAIEIEDEAEKLFKAVGELDADKFKDVVEVIKALNAKVDNSGFFKETGSKTGNTSVVKSTQTDPVAAALVARLSNAQQ